MTIVPLFPRSGTAARRVLHCLSSFTFLVLLFTAAQTGKVEGKELGGGVDEEG